jgi:hypothetical protein
VKSSEQIIIRVDQHQVKLGRYAKVMTFPDCTMETKLLTRFVNENNDLQQQIKAFREQTDTESSAAIAGHFTKLITLKRCWRGSTSCEVTTKPSQGGGVPDWTCTRRKDHTCSR